MMMSSSLLLRHSIQLKQRHSCIRSGCNSSSSGRRCANRNISLTTPSTIQLQCRNSSNSRKLQQGLFQRWVPTTTSRITSFQLLKQQQYRTIWTRVQDLIRSTELTDRMYFNFSNKNSLLQNNPIIECYQNRHTNNGNTPTNNSILNFSKLRPYHVKDIIRMVQSSNKEQQKDPAISADSSAPLFPSFGEDDDKNIAKLLQQTLSFVQQEQDVDDLQLLNYMVQTIQEIKVPYKSLHNITVLMMRLSSSLTLNQVQEWALISDQVANELIKPQLYSIFAHSQYYQCMQQFIQQIEKKQQQQTISNEYDQESVRILLWSAKQLIRERNMMWHGIDSNNNENDIDNNHQELMEAFNDVRINLLDLSSKRRKNSNNKTMNTSLLADMYQYVGIQSELNKYQQVTSSTSATRITNGMENSIMYPDSLQYLHDLNYAMANHLLPMIQEITGTTTTASTRTQLNALLEATQNKQHQDQYRRPTTEEGTPLQQQHRDDQTTMIQLERGYVTLDGALNVLFHLSKDLFGIAIMEEVGNNNKIAWNKSVRLFHMYDDNNDGAATTSNGTSQDNNNTISDTIATTVTSNSNNKRYIGSFYLDPYQRENTLDRNCTMPLLLSPSLKCNGNWGGGGPVVVVSLQIQPPPWDDMNDPVYVSWDDCEALFHEMGHVYQYIIPSMKSNDDDGNAKQSIVSTTNTVAIRGPDNMPYDFTEFLPKFMEHWLSEKSTIYALMTMSQSDRSFSDEEIDAAVRVRSVEKAYRLTQSAYRAELELQLFTKFDIRGKDESMMELQHRLASEFIPYDPPSKDDISPLLEIFQENASGNRISYYRYLWGDCLSALAFNHIKEQYETSNREGHDTNDNSTGIRQIRMNLRKYLLEPGAAIDIDAFMRAFQLKKNVSADALLERYGLVQWEVVNEDNEEENKTSDG